MARKATRTREAGPEDVLEENEGDDKARAYFMTTDGVSEIRIQALKDCWAFQKWEPTIRKETGLPCGWKAYRYVTDLGSVANRIFNLRLKNAEVTTLKELSEASRRIGEEVRAEFNLVIEKTCNNEGKRCKHLLPK
jgi:hypothetical protein